MSENATNKQSDFEPFYHIAIIGDKKRFQKIFNEKKYKAYGVSLNKEKTQFQVNHTVYYLVDSMQCDNLKSLCFTSYYLLDRSGELIDFIWLLERVKLIIKYSN